MLSADIKFSKENINSHNKKHRFSKEKSFDYDQITDEIFIGTNACCLVGYASELVEKNVLADISLEIERIDSPLGVDYFLWLPTIDGASPAKKQLNLGVKVLDFFVRSKIKVYVHCKNGHGRAPTLVASYLAVKKSMSVEEAINFIKQKRSTIHPNKVQLDALRNFKKNFKD